MCLCCRFGADSLWWTVVCAQLGSTAVGIQTADAVILAVEKRLTSTLLEPSRCVL